MLYLKMWERYLILQIYFETYEKVLCSKILPVNTGKHFCEIWERSRKYIILKSSLNVARIIRQ